MRITVITLLALLLVAAGGMCQKNVWIFKSKPSDIVVSGLFAGKTVSLEIMDKRVIDGKTKVKATFEDLRSALSETLKRACPEANFTDTSTDTVAIPLRIVVERYDVRFTGVVFTGITRYRIRVGNSEDKVIEGLCTRGNLFGMATANSVTQKSFDDASRKLLDYLVTATSE